MQCVILAAGLGTRMKELSATTPKPMLRVNGKTLLEHKFDMLPEEVDDIILVVGYLKEVIMEAYGSSYKGKKISYVVQDTLAGTSPAVELSRPYIDGRFLILMGDDIYDAEDIQKLLETPGWAILVQESGDLRGMGNMKVMEDRVVDIVYGDMPVAGGVMNTNAMLIDERYFDGPFIPKSPGSLEYGLPHSVVHQSVLKKIPLEAVYAHKWIQVSSPEDIAKAEALLKN